jgi:hypothetical protein
MGAKYGERVKCLPESNLLEAGVKCGERLKSTSTENSAQKNGQYTMLNFQYSTENDFAILFLYKMIIEIGKAVNWLH